MESGDIQTPNLSKATMRVGKKDSAWRPSHLVVAHVRRIDRAELLGLPLRRALQPRLRVQCGRLPRASLSFSADIHLNVLNSSYDRMYL